MTVQEARELMDFEDMTDEEVRQQIARDKDTMREVIKFFIRNKSMIDSFEEI